MLEIQDKTSQLRLLEVAQVPKEHEDDFKSVKKFNVFNTNNLWIRWTLIDYLFIMYNKINVSLLFWWHDLLSSLPAIQRLVDERTLDMEIIVNPKVLIPLPFLLHRSALRFITVLCTTPQVDISNQMCLVAVPGRRSERVSAWNGSWSRHEVLWQRPRNQRT